MSETATCTLISSVGSLRRHPGESSPVVVSSLSTTTTSTTTGTTNLVTPRKTDQRPMDDLGPPSDPLDFPKPRIRRGRRGEVTCYNPQIEEHELLSDVLYRDCSGGPSGCPPELREKLSEAYWPLPHKEKIKTIMGHVEICLVLKPIQKEEEQGDASETEEVDDMVFEFTTERVAVKVNYSTRMDYYRNRHAEDPMKEIAAMQLIGDDHPNVMGCRDVLFDGQDLNVVMRFCDSGDLFSLLYEPLEGGQTNKEDSRGLSEGEARFYFRQIMSGIQHLHRKGVCHRDLSPENIMLDGKRAIVIDMGMCLRMPYLTDDGKSITDVASATNSRRCFMKRQGRCGKNRYMSPEVYRNGVPFDGQAIDIWTAGTILFCMVTGCPSYQLPHSADRQFFLMSRCLSRLLASWKVELSPQGLHLLENMLQTDPRLRLSLDEVMDHPWFSIPDHV